MIVSAIIIDTRNHSKSNIKQEFRKYIDDRVFIGNCPKTSPLNHLMRHYYRDSDVCKFYCPDDCSIQFFNGKIKYQIPCSQAEPSYFQATPLLECIIKDTFNLGQHPECIEILTLAIMGADIFVKTSLSMLRNVYMLNLFILNGYTPYTETIYLTSSTFEGLDNLQVLNIAVRVQNILSFTQGVFMPIQNIEYFTISTRRNILFQDNTPLPDLQVLSVSPNIWQNLSVIGLNAENIETISITDIFRNERFGHISCVII